MRIERREVNETGIRFSVMQEDREVGRAYLYFLRNDLHEQPFGLMEDVFINESQRGNGVGSRLVERIIEEAKTRGCYKLICTSRSEKLKVHGLYEKLGFKDHGKELVSDINKL